MADNRITAKIVGAEAIEAKLKAFGPKLARKVLSRSLRSGAKIVLRKAQELAPSRTGRLRKSLKVRVAKSRRGRISIMVATGAKWFTGPAFYGAFIEFGHMKAPSHRNSAGRFFSVKSSREQYTKVEGQGFVAQAYEETKNDALKTVETAIAAGIEETAKT